MKDDLNNKISQITFDVTCLMTKLLLEFEVVNNDGKLVGPFAVGKSRVYFKAGALEFLKIKRMVRLGVFATTIEKGVHKFITRSKFLRLKSTSIFLQSIARRNFSRCNLLRSIQAEIILSCWIRIIFSKRELFKLRRQRACVLIQTR